jgi:pSer/pThr/pTyr-binding forkhead associated (FHA) protein
VPVLALPVESATIGRSPECDFHLVEPSVSRRHAELRRDGERCCCATWAHATARA